MSYSIYIGEAYLAVPSEDDLTKYDDIYPSVEVKGMAHPEAPSFPGDDMTGRGNGRHPGYSQWANFVDDVGLRDLFFGARDGGSRDASLMRDHPGCAILRPCDLVEIRQARGRWEAKPWPAPERVAGWDPTLMPFDQREADPKYDGNLARLIWLEWWVTWALANCKVPAIYNR